ncbi:MAG: cobyrinic acid a,c-diamide synthase, partial [Chromatiales bacterium]|nr:cobyrinic acid a,c-diamide synthase [Chromatiales bacterium]
IGGGFPEMVMQELHANSSLRGEIKAFIEAGGPVYAECGGLMYLSRTLTWNGVRCEMVGAIPGDAVMHKKPQGRGYVKLQETGRSPWRQAEAGDNRIIAAHEFHYSAIENLPANTEYAYAVRRGAGIDGLHDGFIYKNLLANYTHMRDVGDNHWTERFLSHIKRCREQQQNRN